MSDAHRIVLDTLGKLHAHAMGYSAIAAPAIVTSTCRCLRSSRRVALKAPSSGCAR